MLEEDINKVLIFYSPLIWEWKQISKGRKGGWCSRGQWWNCERAATTSRRLSYTVQVQCFGNEHADLWKWKLGWIPWPLLAEQVECLWSWVFGGWISCLWFSSRCFLWPLKSNTSKFSVTLGCMKHSPLAVNSRMHSVEMLDLFVCLFFM